MLTSGRHVGFALGTLALHSAIAMMILIYSMVGPILGAGVFWLLSFVPTGFLSMARDSSLHLEAWMAVAKLLPSYVVYGYTIGFLPSFGAGISHSVAARKLPSKGFRILAVASTGAIFQVALLLLLTNQNVFDDLSLASVALISSALMAWSIEKIRSRRKT